MLSRRSLFRAVTLLLVAALLAPGVVGAITHDPGDQSSLQRGTVTDPANGTTVVSNQGYTFRGDTNPKKPARLVAAGERATTAWVYDSRQGADAWFFDVDPLPNGNLLVVSPRNENTLVYELDPETKTRVWTQRLPYTDTHDVDKLDDGRLLVANMRQWDAANETSDDRLLIYNRTTDEVTWEWYFRNHFPASTDGGMKPDWTHVNDVDRIDDHRVLASPRNFDQAIVVNVTTGDIEQRLGADGRHDVLFEQHNPDYLVGENGTPTMLVADSENDRIVEYAKDGDQWVRTWTLEGNLRWPRDADRLPNGNTLVVDSLNHRVVEVTPRGDIVWEYYSTWGPFDAERVTHGDGSQGPTIRELNATGTYTLSGSAGLTAGTGTRPTVAQQLQAGVAGTPLEAPVVDVATRWSHVAPWVRPVWLSSWEFVSVVAGLLLAAAWLFVELVVNRRYVLATVATAVDISGSSHD